MRKLRSLARLARLSVLLLPIAQSACTSASNLQPAVTVIDKSCELFSQGTWSVDDTEKTSTWVRQHNLTYAEHCSKKQDASDYKGV